MLWLPQQDTFLRFTPPVDDPAMRCHCVVVHLMTIDHGIARPFANHQGGLIKVLMRTHTA
jgi:hypothetical protein